MFSDVFRGERKGALTTNGLTQSNRSNILLILQIFAKLIFAILDLNREIEFPETC